MRENIFLSCILVTFCVGLLISFSASWGYMKIISAETYQDSSVKSTNSREHVISSILVYLSPNLTQSLECCDRIKNSHVKFDIHYKSKPNVTLGVKLHVPPMCAALMAKNWRGCCYIIAVWPRGYSPRWITTTFSTRWKQVFFFSTYRAAH